MGFNRERIRIPFVSGFYPDPSVVGRELPEEYDEPSRILGGLLAMNVSPGGSFRDVLVTRII